MFFLKVFFSFLFMSFATSSVCMDFSIHDNDSDTLNAILATGNIEWSDAEKLNALLSQRTWRPHTAVYLSSRGGSLGGGMRLGRYFKRNGIKTVVEGNEVCASACALAFLGGTDRDGNRWMSSTTTSFLGVHSFRNSDGTIYDLTDDVQQVVAEILNYAQHVGAPPEILVRNFETPSDSMYWFSNSELLRLGIKVWDMERKCFVGGTGC
jgi:hypothetical protein